jgi:hypothetical protein
MLARDMLTGQLHEVPEYGYAAPPYGGYPDPQTYGLGEAYDGFGNPLGLMFLPKLIKSAVGAITGGPASIIRSILPGGGGGGGGSAPAPACPPCPPCPACGTPFPQGMMRPAFPYPYPPYPPPPPARRRRRR